MYSFTGYNYIYGARHLVEYSSPDLCIANLIRNNIRYSYGVNSPCEGFISYIYVLLTFFFYIFCAVLLPVYVSTIIIIYTPVFGSTRIWMKKEYHDSHSYS